ncbi:GGDEF domain-containing protein [Flaviflagellibacter deserti]|uniref:diguanylate cyclase n=1 Tax=Flaviflagellibacter deserti TaxID=2267266 RepID=A0ABV9YZU7_9HYPH
MATDTSGAWRSRPTQLSLKGLGGIGKLLPAGRQDAASTGQAAQVDVLLDKIREQERRIAELEAMAVIDPLTEVLNRRGFDRSLALALDQHVRYGTEVSIAVIDIDDFKAINDRFGHAVGDEVLVRVARLLRASLRASDIVARTGGDEFVVLLWHLDAHRASRRLANLLSAIKDIPTASRRAGPCFSLSFGVAGFEDGDSPADVLSRADKRMYARKKRRSLRRKVTVSAIVKEGGV